MSKCSAPPVVAVEKALHSPPGVFPPTHCTHLSPDGYNATPLSGHPPNKRRPLIFRGANPLLGVLRRRAGVRPPSLLWFVAFSPLADPAGLSLCVVASARRCGRGLLLSCSLRDCGLEPSARCRLRAVPPSAPLCSAPPVASPSVGLCSAPPFF